MKINKYIIHKNKKIVNYDYKVGNKLILNNKSTCKYETPYIGSFEMTQCWTNITVTLQMVAIKIMYNICHIKTYKL